VIDPRARRGSGKQLRDRLLVRRDLDRKRHLALAFDADAEPQRPIRWHHHVVPKRGAPRQSDRLAVLVPETNLCDQARIRRRACFGRLLGCVSNPNGIDCHRNVLTLDWYGSAERQQQVVLAGFHVLPRQLDVVVDKRFALGEVNRLQLFVVEVRRECLGAVWPEPNARNERLLHVRLEVHPTPHPHVGVAGVAVDPLADPATSPIAYRVLRLCRSAEVDVPTAVIDLGEVAKRGQVRMRLEPHERVALGPSSATPRGHRKGHDRQQTESHWPPSSRARAAVFAPLFDPQEPCCG